MTTTTTIELRCSSCGGPRLRAAIGWEAWLALPGDAPELVLLCKSCGSSMGFIFTDHDADKGTSAQVVLNAP